MADPSRSRDTGQGAGVGPDRGPTSGTPRWVKVSAIIALVVVLLFVLLFVIRGPSGHGGHGPGRHFSSSQAAQPGGQRR